MKRLYLPPWISGGIFVFVVLAWFYRDLIHVWLFDPFIASRDPGPETVQYWEIKYTLRYIKELAPWLILALAWPVSDRFTKWVFLTIALSHLWGVIDQVATGNGAATLEPAGVIASAAWAGLCHNVFWSQEVTQDEIRPGVAYRVSKPPRTLLELIGTYVRPRWEGTVEFYTNGHRYHFSRKRGKFERVPAPDYSPPPHYKVEALAIDPDELDRRAGRYIGRNWSLWFTCHRVSRIILH